MGRPRGALPRAAAAAWGAAALASLNENCTYLQSLPTMFLRIDQVEVRYPGAAQPAVQGATLGLRAGDIGVLIGPSGCGKTTLLRAVAGLERLSAGSIRLGDELVSSARAHVAPEQRRVGMVFQDYALFPHLDVAHNVAFGIRQRPAAERATRVAEVLALVDLAGAQGRFPHELSGGQQQRVALARAMAPAPRLLLLDEPFSNLDVDLRERLAHELRGILKAAGATALFVTHDLSEAVRVADRLLVLSEGGTGFVTERRIEGRPGERSDRAIFDLVETWSRDPAFAELFDGERKELS